MSHDTSTSNGNVADAIDDFVEVHLSEVCKWFGEVRIW